MNALVKYITAANMLSVLILKEATIAHVMTDSTEMDTTVQVCYARVLPNPIPRFPPYARLRLQMWAIMFTYGMIHDQTKLIS